MMSDRAEQEVCKRCASGPRHGAGMDLRADETIGRRPVAWARRRLLAVVTHVRDPRRSHGRHGYERPRRVSVVLSDMVSSTQLLEIAGAGYPRLLMRHRALIAGAVARLGGRFISHAGDGTLAVFDRADDAIAASVEAQRALAAERWPDGLVPRVRMGVHTGDVVEVDGEPVGLVINHGARVMAAACAGQVMVSAAAAEAGARAGAPRSGDVTIADAGWHTLRDHAGPVRLRQVVADGLTVTLPTERHIDLTDAADGPAGVDAAPARLR